LQENFNWLDEDFDKSAGNLGTKNKDLINKYRGDYGKLARLYSGGRVIFKI